MLAYLVLSTAVVTGFSQTSVTESESFDILSLHCFSVFSNNRSRGSINV